jgi:hypothetical protein
MAMATASPAKSVAIVTTSPWRATAQGDGGGHKGRMVWEEVSDGNERMCVHKCTPPTYALALLPIISQG